MSSAPPPRVQFQVLLDSLGSLFPEVFFASRIPPKEVRVAIMSCLLRDQDFALTIDPSSEFGSSFPYRVHYKVPDSSWLADCSFFSLGAWHVFCCTRTLEWWETITVVQIYLKGEFEHLAPQTL